MLTKKGNRYLISSAKLLTIEHRIITFAAKRDGVIVRADLNDSLENLSSQHIEIGLSSLVDKAMIRQTHPNVWRLTVEGWRFLGGTIPRGVTCA